MANFNLAIDKVIKSEGGYIYDPDDAGGETIFGISRRANPNWLGWKIVDKVKKEHPVDYKKLLNNNIELLNKAKLLYKQKYWDVMELDDIPSQKLAFQMFDTAVNMGVSKAISITQRLLGMTATGKWNEETKTNLMNYKHG